MAANIDQMSHGRFILGVGAGWAKQEFEALDDERRLPGEGTPDQVRGDLEALESLGAEYGLLDTYGGDPEETRHHERAWNMLTTLAEGVLDLEHQRLR